MEISTMTPVIVSASRATDIPAFYSDWLVDRWRIGYVKWKNPFNAKYSSVSFEKTRLIVFWTKNPKPLMFKNLRFFEERGICFYFQFTLNDYENEGLELNVEPLARRIETFQRLSERIGKEKVVWRFDPLVLTNKLGVDELLRKVEIVGKEVNQYTEKLVFSFSDIANYRKVQKNLTGAGISAREFSDKEMKSFALGLREINSSWNLKLATCAEKIDLDEFGIRHIKCIDEELIISLFPYDIELMKYLGVFNGISKSESKNSNKDKGQRIECGCIKSKDIGQYNTCPQNCVYCYANINNLTAQRNYSHHVHNSFGETIIG